MQIHVDILGASFEAELEIRQMFDPADAAWTSAVLTADQNEPFQIYFI